jgi:hypothetical protein
VSTPFVKEIADRRPKRGSCWGPLGIVEENGGPVAPELGPGAPRCTRAGRLAEVGAHGGRRGVASGASAPLATTSPAYGDVRGKQSPTVDVRLKRHARWIVRPSARP